MKKSTKRAVIVSSIVIAATIIIILITMLILNKNLESKLSDEISIIGEIKSVSNDENKKGNIYVEGELLSNTIYDKASISILSSTKITSKETGEKLKITDLAIGDIVEVWFDGEVNESYPVQAAALWIKVRQ